MIPRSAQLSRTCLACRLGMPPRPIAFLTRFPSSLSRRPQRRLASNFTVQSKERVEALISGTLDDFSSDSKGKGAKRRNSHRGPKGRPRGKFGRRLPQGDVAPTRRDTGVGQVIRDAEPDGVSAREENDTLPLDGVSAREENDIPPETAQEGDEAASLHPDGEKDVRRATFRHSLLRRESLGVNALGKPIEALILKNPNRLRRARKPKPLIEDEPAGPAPPLTWESVLPQNLDDSDYSDEVWRNIEDIRPQDTILRRRDFDKLMKYLLDGFTYGQLVTYFSHGTWDDTRNVENGPSYPWILEQSPWTAAEPELILAKDLTAKERRAMMILRAKWKLEIQEHIEGLGGRVLWLKPTVFKLITRSSNSVSFSQNMRMVI
ncbi:hypothetical protein E4U42_005543 [Claviceps africana]|uniref:SLS1 N-terminal domain-containing protein n=1 Tax=Claviceps africana TaxID=83212 RepID=A0A8K0NHC9_9HYPO|nr:hypothetical protein E4U42_005543 [Claviceps africana]